MKWSEVEEQVDLEALGDEAIDYNIIHYGINSILDGRGGTDVEGLDEFLGKNPFIKEYLDDEEQDLDDGYSMYVGELLRKQRGIVKEIASKSKKR